MKGKKQRVPMLKTIADMDQPANDSPVEVRNGSDAAKAGPAVASCKAAKPAISLLASLKIKVSVGRAADGS